MAANFGLNAADQPDSYNVKGFAQNLLEATLATGHDMRQPLFKRLFAIHNQGHGDKVRGGRARAEGVKTGVPDLCLPVSRWHKEGQFQFSCVNSSYNAKTNILWMLSSDLYIELKTRTQMKAGVRKAQVIAKRAGQASEAQEDWIEFLRSEGKVAEICEGWEEARNLILTYMGII
jgi:hypothetical protein